MIDQEWQGGKKDKRLYDKVRSEKKKMVREKYERLEPHLDERGKKLWAANEAIAFGQGGIRAVSEAVGMSPKAVIHGRRELEGKLNPEQIRNRDGSDGREVDANRQWRSNRVWWRPSRTSLSRQPGGIR